MNEAISETRDILVLDENVAPLTLVVLRCLGKFKEYKLHVLSFSKNNNPQFRYSRYASSFRRVEYTDEDNAFTYIKKRAEEIQAGIIVPVNERMVKIMSIHMNDWAALCKTPLIPEINTLNTVRHKWELYNWLYNNHFPGDKPVLLKEAVEDEQVRKTLAFPLLIKPNWGSGGQGIRYVKDLTEFEAVLKEYNDPHEYVIQRIIPGHDIDISFLARDGMLIAYCIQQSTEKSKRFVYARSIKFIHNDELLQQTSSIIKQLNFSGIAHLDFRYDSVYNNYKLVDFNARYWSSLLGSLTAGINFPWLAINLENNPDVKDYRCINYSMDLNFIRLLWNRIPLKYTEFYYNVQDPFPFILDLFYKFRYHLRKALGFSFFRKKRT